MQLIRCTKKLQKEMCLKTADLVDEEIESETLGGWHANLLAINRRKCVLFTNDKTLFNFIITGVKKVQLAQLHTLFKDHLQCILADEEIDTATRSQIMQEYQTIRFANTNSKSVLGAMNDLAFHYEVHICDDGGVNGCLLPSIINKLNRMPMKRLNYNYPIDALQSLYRLQAAP